MSCPLTSPFLDAFASALGDEFLLAEVLIRRLGASGFELCHVRDRTAAAESLTRRPLAELRALSSVTASGEFRPIKSAPNLVSGWRCEAGSVAELGDAVERLYPGAVADWYAARGEAPPVTHYREFTRRQGGMYRITQMLTDEQAGRMTQACCEARFCLKRRLWTVPGLSPDAPAAKSAIPCLEPCAPLLEFARKAMRIEQSDPVPIAMDDLEAMGAILESLAGAVQAEGREADFGTPLNPRRVALLQAKIQAILALRGKESEAKH